MHFGMIFHKPLLVKLDFTTSIEKSSNFIALLLFSISKYCREDL